MTSIKISVNSRTGRLFFDGIRLSDGCWVLDTRKVRVTVRKQCKIADWANDRIARSFPFVVRAGKHSKLPVPNLQRTFKRATKHETNPVKYEGLYVDSLFGTEFAVLKPINRSKWRVVLGHEYFRLFDSAGLQFESPLPTGGSRTVGGRGVLDALRIVTPRGAMCGFLLPCRTGRSMAELRKGVVKAGRGKVVADD